MLNKDSNSATNSSAEKFVLFMRLFGEGDIEQGFHVFFGQLLQKALIV